MPPPEFLIDNLVKATHDGFNQYTMFLGHPIFREKLAEFYSPLFKKGKDNKDLNPNNEIVVTAGATEAMFSTIHNLIDDGDEVITFEPFFSPYMSCVDFAGGKLKTAPMKVVNGKWECDFDALD